ncbi:MAG: LPP20 family lipoprotein [Deltaproteobacteria bacterium]|nr:LPP20 family lipoprotein [Deltaproteobacteria bacterium]
MKTLSCTIALALIAGGCSHPGYGPSAPISGVNPDGSPRWVQKGSGAFDGPHGKAFYGVGLVQGIQNPSLRRQTADNRARGEIAKIFDTYIAAMMKDYQRSTTAGNFQASAEEQDVISAQKTVTEVTLRGVEIRDHWIDPQNGALYALAVLDMNAIGKGLDDAKQLDPRVRDYVRDNARKAFEDLDAELSKRRDGAAPAAEPAQPAEPAPAEPAPAEPATPAAPPAAAAPAVDPGSVKIGLMVNGPNRATVQTCFAEKLVSAGFKVFENTRDVRFLVRADLSYKRAGVVNGAHMVNAEANVRVQDLSNGQTLVAIADKVKVGRNTLNQSVQLAVTRLCNNVAPRAVAKIKSSL